MARSHSFLGPGEGEGNMDTRLGSPSAGLLLSWVGLEARKIALGPACLDLTLACYSLVLCPQPGCFASPGLSFLLCEIG